MPFDHAGLLGTIRCVRLAALLSLLIEPIAPGACASCQVPGPVLCTDCADALVVLRAPRCGWCGHPWPASAERCRACVPGLPRARAAIAYDARAGALMSALKDRRRRAVADALASVVAATLAPPPSGWVLVPVPLGRARLAERGFDQALAIARGLSERWDRGVSRALSRHEDGRPQRAAPRRERLRLSPDTFAARPPVPSRCCLVDDVHTTGATLAAAARALRRAGAPEVAAVTVARTMAPGAELPLSHARRSCPSTRVGLVDS